MLTFFLSIRACLLRDTNYMQTRRILAIVHMYYLGGGTMNSSKKTDVVAYSRPRNISGALIRCHQIAESFTLKKLA
jgi:hypothetical protein